MSIPAMTRFVEATVGGLGADKPAIVRISAVRAIWGFSSHLRTSANRTLLTPFLPAATDALINMCGAFNSSSEVLGLIMENMSLVLAVICTQFIKVIFFYFIYFFSAMQILRRVMRQK
jgi:hypothetical protein